LSAVELGGFDENLIGPEDWDFDRRVRGIGKVSIIDSPVYHNEGEFSFRRYVNKKAYYAKSFDKYIKKWPGEDSVIKQQLGLGYRYVGVFVENGKWKRLIRNPVLTVSMYVLRVIIGRMYIMDKMGRIKDG